MEQRLKACVLSRNRDLLFTIRQYILSIGISTHNAINYYELVNFAEICHSQILIIDTSSIELNKEFLLLFERNDSKYFVPNIVLLTKENVQIEEYDCILTNNFCEQFSNMLPKMLTNVFNMPQSKKKYSVKEIGSYLICIGINANLSGFIYLRDCIHFLVNVDMPMFCMSHNVYKTLSKKYNKSACSIEKDMRYAIKKYIEQNSDMANCMSTKKAIAYLANKF